jgi:CheY-like chemotaxis protein
MMSGVSGMDVHARIAEARPDLLPRVILMTGGACTARAADFLASVPNRILEKPFAYADLLRAVQSVLG